MLLLEVVLASLKLQYQDSSYYQSKTAKSVLPQTLDSGRCLSDAVEEIGKGTS